MVIDLLELIDSNENPVLTWRQHGPRAGFSELRYARETVSGCQRKISVKDKPTVAQCWGCSPLNGVIQCASKRVEGR